MPPKKKAEPKYKTKVKIVDVQTVQGVCTCGWKGSRMVGTTDLAATMTLSKAEIAKHTHLVKE